MYDAWLKYNCFDVQMEIWESDFITVYVKGDYICRL